MPTARQPCSFASCPTTPPTAPLAAETSTVSPALGAQYSSRPIHAVAPGMPHTPRYADSGTSLGSTTVKPSPWERAYICQPSEPTTWSPTLNFGLFDSTTWPTVPPTMTSPISTYLV